jgi:CspA family cold shock protein
VEFYATGGEFDMARDLSPGFVADGDDAPAGEGRAQDRAMTPGDAADFDVIEVVGSIKWFDVSKGFGFIVPDDGRPDVLVHVTCLRRDGYQTAHEGARVVCEALARPGGLQAFRILSMDESTARHPSQMPAPRTHVTVEPTSALERLEVKWFNRIRGFGFLSKGEGCPDIFVHMETLRRFGITELRPGQFVLVRYGQGPKGLMVAEIRPDGWGEAPYSH